MPPEFEEDLIALDHYRNPRYVRIEPIYNPQQHVRDVAQGALLGIVGVFAFLAVLAALLAYMPK